jgi:hypothetical protein
MKRTFGMSVIVGLCGLCALSNGSAWADSSPFVGRWLLNKAQSKLPPGETIPGDMMMDFSRVDSTHVRWTVTVTDAQGHPSVQSFDTPANGEFYPVSGDTTAAFNLNGSSLQGTFKGPAGQTDAMTCVVSTDQRKMTCDGVVTGGNGKATKYVDVYDRK